MFSGFFLKRWWQIICYRSGQVRQQLGFVPPLEPMDYVEVQRWLPPSALPLFKSMGVADQQHSLRVCRGLQARGCHEEAMLAAALLHDVGKAQGRVPFWARPAIVVGKLVSPRLLQKVAVNPLSHEGQRAALWRSSLGYAWWHAEVGAELAAAAGLSERSVLYIRTHHQPQGPAAILHEVDEVS